MTKRHRLDGNAIAADEYYDRADYDDCSCCDISFAVVQKHACWQDLCLDCGDAADGGALS